MLLDPEDADAACAVIDGAERGDFQLYICSLSFTNIYYSLRHVLSREQRISALLQHREILHVVDEPRAMLCCCFRTFLCETGVN